MEKLIKKIITSSPLETLKEARELAVDLKPGAIIGLIGDLGCGKTLFTQGIAEYLNVEEPVTSPSFTLINIYETKKMPIYHFDLYRLNSQEDLENIGYEEYFYGKGISLVEWADKCPDVFPEGSLLIYFQYIDLEKREIKICLK